MLSVPGMVALARVFDIDGDLCAGARARLRDAVSALHLFQVLTRGLANSQLPDPARDVRDRASAAARDGLEFVRAAEPQLEERAETGRRHLRVAADDVVDHDPRREPAKGDRRADYGGLCVPPDVDPHQQPDSL